MSADAKLLGLKPKTDANFFVSDEVLKRDGFVKLLTHIKQNDVKEISIVGGSHSGLSCAWMLINGSAMYDYKDYQPQEFDMDFFDPELREQMFTKQKAKVPKESRKYRCTRRIKSKLEHPPSEFSELGEEFEYLPWNVGGILSHPDFCHIKIKIICKNELKVNYKLKEEAAMDGYTNFTNNCINSKGIIYPFTGLRGDAKQLWRRVTILKTEDQIEFIKANNQASQKLAIKNSDVVIWACGYESKPIPININNPLMNKQEPLDLKRVGTNQFEVDDDLRLVVKNSSNVYNLFGIGLGYSIKTTNKHIKAEKDLNSRADGVRLYVSIVPTVLFSGICPKRTLGKNLKFTLANRAVSMQRTNTGSCSNKRERVNSVVKDIKNEITPIEEIPPRVSKYKRSRALPNKQEDKLSKIYEESKNKINKNPKKKPQKTKFLNRNKPKKTLHARRIDSQDSENINPEVCSYESPLKKEVTAEQLCSKKELGCISGLDPDIEYDYPIEMRTTKKQTYSIPKTMHAKDRMKNLLENNDDSQITVVADNQNYRFNKTEQDFNSNTYSPFNTTQSAIGSYFM